MRRGSEDNNYETSPSHTKRLRCVVDINIPLDLTVEILKKLPVKSLMRFQCVSKQWSSIISSRPDFIDSIVARPLPLRDTKLIIHHQYYCYPKRSFLIFSSTDPENIDKESVVSSDLKGYWWYVRGLMCLWSDSLSRIAIYNPTTRQSLPLPENPWRSTIDFCFFGYDPHENQYKVLCLPKYKTNKEEACQVFTLGDPTEKQWRDIKGRGPHCPLPRAVCVNGTIYYLATTRRVLGGITTSGDTTYFLVSFDVRFEKFGRVEAPEKTTHPHCSFLIKYQEKLGFMYCRNGVEIWVMEDGGMKQEWSKIIFYQMEGFEYWFTHGVTHSGEIVLVDKLQKYCRYVYYYDPKENSLRRVQVRAPKMEDKCEDILHMRAVPDHVENTMRL